MILAHQKGVFPQDFLRGQVQTLRPCEVHAGVGRVGQQVGDWKQGSDGGLCRVEWLLLVLLLDAATTAPAPAAAGGVVVYSGCKQNNSINEGEKTSETVMTTVV